MELPSYKPKSKPTTASSTANTSQNHRKCRKSIFAISSSNIDANKLDLRKNRKKQSMSNHTFRTGQIRYDQPIYLNQTNTPERERRMAAKREHQNNYSASAWRNKDKFGYDYSRPRTFQTFRNLDMDRIPFKPINNNDNSIDVHDDTFQFGDFHDQPKISSTPFVRPGDKSSTSKRCSETNMLIEENTDDLLESLAEKENAQYGINNIQIQNDETDDQTTETFDTIIERKEPSVEKPSAEWNPEMISEKLSIKDLAPSEPEEQERDPNSSLLEEDKDRDILMEMENYTSRLENIRGNQMFLHRKFPQIRGMIEDLEKNKEKSMYRWDDILGAWNNVTIEMDKAINREVTEKSLAEIVEEKDEEEEEKKKEN